MTENHNGGNEIVLYALARTHARTNTHAHTYIDVCACTGEREGGKGRERWGDLPVFASASIVPLITFFIESS